MRSTRVACFVLPIDGDSVLLARHTHAHSDLWAMVGGMAEPRETLRETAGREAEEESGLKIRVGNLIGCVEHTDLLAIAFSGVVEGGTLSPQVDEIAELRWCTLADLDDMNVLGFALDLARSVLTLGDDVGLSQAVTPWPTGGARASFVPRLES